MKKYIFTGFFLLVGATVMVYVGISSSFLVRFLLDQQIVELRAAGQSVAFLESIVRVISNPLYLYGVWGLFGAYLGWRLSKTTQVAAIFSDNLKSAFVYGILALISLVVKAGIIGAILGIVGFFKSKQAVKEGKLWGVLAGILNLIPVLYVLFILFILGYTLTSR